MGQYIEQVNLERALSPKTVLAIFDDAPAKGRVNQEALAEVIERAEAEVDSWLVGIYTQPIAAPFDRLLKHAALDYAVAFSFERHPEYVRTFGEDQRAQRWKRANDRMMRIRDGLQRLPDQPRAATAPKNSGALIYDKSARVMIDNADGRENNNGY